jgi:CHAT domain-containing protein/Tfp pilus assembly protein PilF
MRSRTVPQKFAVLLTLLIIVLPFSLGTVMRGQSTSTQTEGRGARLVGVRVQDEDGKVVTLYNESHALIIGISNYTNGWKVLGGVKNDVPLVKEALQKHGFVVEELLDKTKAEIRHGVETFISKWGETENNRLLIYFAGHGETLTMRDGSKVGYIVPVDAPKANQQSPGAFKQSAISLDEVEIWAKQIDSKHVLFVFDSCFSGALYDQRSTPQFPAAIMADAGNPVRQFITSGTGEQEVPDQSIFRDVFTRALDGAGDLNDDGYVTGTELGMHLRDKVSNYTEKAQTPQYWKIRNPRLDKGDFVFILPRKIDQTFIAEQKTKALASIGLAYASTAEKQDVLWNYRRMLPRRQQVNDRYGEAEILNNIGLIQESFGAYEEALNCFKLALAFWRSVNERRGESYTLNNIGRVYASLNENEKALSYYEESLPIFRALFDRAGEGSALTNIGAAYAALGDTQKALKYLTESIPLLQAVDDTAGEAITLVTVGKVYAFIGDYQKALEYSNRALAPLRSLGHRPGEAEALNNAGAAHASLGNYAKAIDFYDQALALKREIGHRGGEAETLSSIARAEQNRGNLKEAQARIEEALVITESLREQVTGRELRAAFFALGQKQYSLYVDVLQQLHLTNPSRGYDAAALLASERSRARGLLELLTEARTDFRAGVDPALIQREQDLQRQLSDKLNAQMRLLAGRASPEKVSAAKKAIEELVAEIEDVQTEIKRSSPRYAARIQPPPLDLQEIQQKVLDPDTLLLEYALGDERSYLWAVTPNSIKSYVLPPRQQIETAARNFYYQSSKYLTDRPATDDEGMSLSRMLLGVVASELRSKRRLLIVADGALHYVPFAALPDPNARPGESGAALRPLIIAHEIVNVPSASTLAELRRAQANRKPAPKALAVFADPVYDARDERLNGTKGISSPPQSDFDFGVRLSRLPFARFEAQQILSLVRDDARAMFGFEANRAAALSSELGQYRIIHFATHSYFNNSHPELSGIFLSAVDVNGQPQNGLLLAHDVYSMNLQADLVVLSSCSSGLGKEVNGEGVAGFARAFMYAGAPRVVVSLWSVDDRMTAELMTRFYSGMLKQGLPPSAALRQAQVSLLHDKRFAAPFAWGAFVLVGDWR